MEVVVVVGLCGWWMVWMVDDGVEVVVVEVCVWVVWLVDGQIIGPR